MMDKNFDDKAYRDAFTESMIRTGLAFQLRELRKRSGMSQKELGRLAGTTQNVISRLENPDYGSFTLKTLLRLASSLDVALIVKFATFGELHQMTRDRSPDALAVPSYRVEKERANKSKIGETNARPDTRSGAVVLADFRRSHATEEFGGRKRVSGLSNLVTNMSFAHGT